MNIKTVRQKMRADLLNRAYAKAQARQRAANRLEKPILGNPVKVRVDISGEMRKRALARASKPVLKGPKPSGVICQKARSPVAWPEEAGRLGWHEGRYSLGRPEHWH